MFEMTRAINNHHTRQSSKCDLSVLHATDGPKSSAMEA
jgi:hypothetical protein